MTAIDLRSDALAFHLRLPEGRWDLFRLPQTGAYLDSAAMSARWKLGRQEQRWDGDLREADVGGFESVTLPAGEFSTIRLRWRVTPPDLRFGLEFGLGKTSPLLIWRMSMTNKGDAPIELGDLEMLRVGPLQRTRPRLDPRALLRPSRPAEGNVGALRVSASPGEMGFFANGWQSWVYSGALGMRDRMPRTRLGPLTRPARENQGTRRPTARGEFASDWFGIVGSRSARTGILAGFLTQREAFGSLWASLDEYAPALRLWAHGDQAIIRPEASFTTDWACLQYIDLDSGDPLGCFLDAVARMNGARSAGHVPVGWCSWYQYFGRLAEDDLNSNLEWARQHRREVPLQLFQIDDGFEAKVGDWEEVTDRFPSGVARWAQRIRDAGFQPGLWLAPFVAQPESKLVRTHPAWVLRTRRGRPVNAGFEWNRLGRALDTTHPEVVDYVKKLVRVAVKEWGFDYLKLDFLYGGALAGRRWDPTRTRAQAMYSILRGIRDEVGEGVTLVGCGCPLGSAVGIVDAMRVTADVAPRWNPAYFGTEFFFRPEPDFPSARNAIRNTLTRAPLHRRWWVNDPDCMLVRADASHLTPAEVQTLATAIALSSGSMIDSDSLVGLSEERREWLARLLPILPTPARWIDWFDSSDPSRGILPLEGPGGSWHLVALINWEDSPREVRIDLKPLGLSGEGGFHSVDFWEASYARIDGSAWSGPIPAHGVRMLALRPAKETLAWLGDTLHISAGMAVRGWRVQPSGLEIDLDLGRSARGAAWLALPGAPERCEVEGLAVPWSAVADGVYRADLAFEGAARLRIDWASDG